MPATTRLFLHALEALLILAHAATDTPLSGRELAALQHLPPRTLEPGLQKLARAGILHSARGPQGGYTLGREKRRISLADVHRALGEKPAAPTRRSALYNAVLQPALHRLNGEALERMAALTLADLCAAAETAAIPRRGGERQDFTI